MKLTKIIIGILFLFSAQLAFASNKAERVGGGGVTGNGFKETIEVPNQVSNGGGIAGFLSIDQSQRSKF